MAGPCTGNKWNQRRNVWLWWNSEDIGLLLVCCCVFQIANRWNLVLWWAHKVWTEMWLSSHHFVWYNNWIRIFWMRSTDQLPDYHFSFFLLVCFSLAFLYLLMESSVNVYWMIWSPICWRTVKQISREKSNTCFYSHQVFLTCLEKMWCFVDFACLIKGESDEVKKWGSGNSSLWNLGIG